MLRYILICSVFIATISSCKCNNGNQTAGTGKTTLNTAPATTADGTKATTDNIAATGATSEMTNDQSTAGTNDNAQKNSKAGYALGRVRSRSASGTPGYFPEGSERLLVEKDLEYLTAWGLAVMKNEIYARHGMTFAAGPMKDHFEEQSWYRGKSGNVRSKLSNTERANLNFIENYKLKPSAELASLNG